MNLHKDFKVGFRFDKVSLSVTSEELQKRLYLNWRTFLYFMVKCVTLYNRICNYAALCLAVI